MWGLALLLFPEFIIVFVLTMISLVDLLENLFLVLRGLFSPDP